MKSLQKIYLSLFCLVIIVVLSVVFLIYPFFNQVRNSSQELVLEKSRLNALSFEKENFKNIEAVYKNYQGDLDKIDKLFVDSSFPVDFISFLEKNASSSNVNLVKSSSLNKKSDEDPWPNMTFNLSLSGSFPNILKFIERIESAPYLIEITDFSTNKAGGQELKTSTNENFASVILKVYIK